MYVDKPYEKIVERIQDVPYDVYVDKEIIREVEKPIIKDIVVEKKVEVPYTKYVDVPEIKKVKKSIVVPRYVDKPVEVVREVEKPFTRR